MSDQTSKSIEERLKAAAEQRRAEQGQEFALSPHQEAQLLRHVRGKWTGRAASPGWMSFWAPRLAWAASLGAFALLAVAVFVRQNPPSDIQEQSARAPAPVPVFSDASGTADASPEANSQPRLAEQQPVQLSEASTDEPSLGAAAPKSVERSYAVAPSRDRAPAPLPAEERTSTSSQSERFGIAPPAQQLEREETNAEERGTRRILPSARIQAQDPAGEARSKFYFRQSSPAAQQILRSFTLSQDGNQIVLAEPDGSTYRGVVTNTAAASAAGRRQQFAAEGTNLSLNAKVSIRGVIEPATEPEERPRAFAGRSAVARQRIRGTIQASGRPAVTLDALAEVTPSSAPAARPQPER